VGSWGTGLDESDAYADIYEHFFEQYNNGAAPEAATQSVRDELGGYLTDYDDQYDAHFALALAQWETQSLEPALVEKIRDFIDSGADLKAWEDRGADPESLEKRASVLSLFLTKIGKPRASKKRRKKTNFDFRQDILVELVAPDGMKTFSVGEEYSNDEYSQTGAMMTWANGGGGSVFYFIKQGAHVSARWIDSQNLEVSVEAGIEYLKKEDWAFFCGDKVDVQYKDA